MTEIITLPLNKIRTDGGTQPRFALDIHIIHEYRALMDAGTQFPPVIVFYDGSDYWLADGFHRFNAVLKYPPIKPTEIAAEVRQGTQRDAVLFSVGANASHGLRRSGGDKRRAVARLLKDDEWGTWSDREIARRCAVSHPFVATVRQEMIKAGEIEDVVERRYTRDGEQRVMDVTDIQAANEQRADAADTTQSPPGYDTWRELNGDNVSGADELFDSVPSPKAKAEPHYPRQFVFEDRLVALIEEEHLEKTTRYTATIFAEANGSVFDRGWTAPDARVALHLAAEIARQLIGMMGGRLGKPFDDESEQPSDSEPMTTPVHEHLKRSILHIIKAHKHKRPEFREIRAKLTTSADGELLSVALLTGLLGEMESDGLVIRRPHQRYDLGPNAAAALETVSSGPENDTCEICGKTGVSPISGICEECETRPTRCAHCGEEHDDWKRGTFGSQKVPVWVCGRCDMASMTPGTLLGPVDEPEAEPEAPTPREEREEPAGDGDTAFSDRPRKMSLAEARDRIAEVHYRRPLWRNEIKKRSGVTGPIFDEALAFDIEAGNLVEYTIKGRRCYLPAGYVPPGYEPDPAHLGDIMTALENLGGETTYSAIRTILDDLEPYQVYAAVWTLAWDGKIEWYRDRIFIAGLHDDVEDELPDPDPVDEVLKAARRLLLPFDWMIYTTEQADRLRRAADVLIQVATNIEQASQQPDGEPESAAATTSA
jgi:DNA-binding HxlR family transcriptional regulator